MDYLQTLEQQMDALQRKIRLLQDLRHFIERSSPEELAAFGAELEAVAMPSGASLGSALAAILGNASRGDTADLPGEVASAARQAPPAPTEAPVAARPMQEPEPGGAAETAARRPPAGGGASVDGRTLFEAAMKTIPANSFIMGSETKDDEKPPHEVDLSSFRLCDHLVTYKEYSQFVAANPQWSKDRADSELRDDNYLSDWGENGFPEGKEDHPVAFVSFHAAGAFAAWAGMRLPTEAEWEYGARGALVGKNYPNGDLMNEKLANLAKQNRGTTPVRRFEPNGFGLYDMAGNLFEWTSDWYGPYSQPGRKNPAGPATGDYKVVRGGSWMSGAGALRVSARFDMEPRHCGQVGIRLADGG